MKIVVNHPTRPRSILVRLFYIKDLDGDHYALGLGSEDSTQPTAILARLVPINSFASGEAGWHDDIDLLDSILDDAKISWPLVSTIPPEADVSKLIPDYPDADDTYAAHQAWWRGNDHAHKMFCIYVNEILDGKAREGGVAYEPWESTRLRLHELVKRTVTMTSKPNWYAPLRHGPRIRTLIEIADPRLKLTLHMSDTVPSTAVFSVGPWASYEWISWGEKKTYPRED